ncbi:MAG: PilZ domain-containing protein [Candidatus Omnitrophica bacterium]|nr:PilZ domain-containing protein [Candidatus Omnitrophota bacterium]
MEKRQFFRHPLSVPIQYHETQSTAFEKTPSVDLSEGGICFLSERYLAKGTRIGLRIPVGGQIFRINGQVAYCHRMSKVERFRTGVAFRDATSVFRAKLAEEIVQIREYQKMLSRKLGHEVSQEEAARQWVGKYAKRFSELF